MSQRLTWLVLLTIVLVLSTFASATCPVPSSPGIKICSPGDGQAVSYPAEIKASATGKASITKMAVYVDNMRIYYDSGRHLDLIDGGIKAGSHRLTVRAWDASGSSYSSTRQFSVVGGTDAKCIPDGPGVKLCSPANGSLQPVNQFTVVAGATGDGYRITRLKVIWRGTTIGDTTSNTLTLEAGSGVPRLDTMTAKAWDAAGHVYSTTNTFKTYYSGECSDYGCEPGVFIQSPTDGSTVGSSFVLSADVRGNPARIAAIRAYLDATLVASSSGSTLSSQVTSSPGSHKLTVQAWDSQGHLYRTVYHITVQ